MEKFGRNYKKRRKNRGKREKGNLFVPGCIEYSGRGEP